MQLDNLNVELLNPAGSNQRQTSLNYGNSNTQSVNQPHNRLQAADILTNIRLCKFKNNTPTLRFFALHQSIAQPALEAGAN